MLPMSLLQCMPSVTRSMMLVKYSMGSGRRISQNPVNWNTTISCFFRDGDHKGAYELFGLMNFPNEITWSAVSAGYVQNDRLEDALRVFKKMREECYETSHAGLVEECLTYFKEMDKEYGITPIDENYGSVVDLLARAGRLDEAKSFIAAMLKKPGPSVWGALLCVCKIHGEVEKAKKAAKILLKLEPKEDGFQKLLSSLYSETRMLDKREEVISEMREMGISKRQGLSWLETGKGNYEFIYEDTGRIHDNGFLVC
ncbi:hypothetical protein GIB67_026602 [Kingdonia uniflora]|uniref:Pentatricopeptide repeat-containing protein n=1 Tax=Kingdonia uniflora TaxID=39325 RepID=A0A7J7NNH5_9MAGN|nr:hypothetical protein GIB67_026602 [Kingdonia uniflora]